MKRFWWKFRYAAAMLYHTWMEDFWYAYECAGNSYDTLMEDFGVIDYGPMESMWEEAYSWGD